MNIDGAQCLPRQGHKYVDSADSEISFFETASSSTSDSWVSSAIVGWIDDRTNFTQSSYFESWESQQQDDYCPQIASVNNSPSRPAHSTDTRMLDDDDDLLPAAVTRKQRNSDHDMMDLPQQSRPARQSARQSKVKRLGIVPYADSKPGECAVQQMNELLFNSSTSTEDILGAMYNPNWDLQSLQQWYNNSYRTPADLALYKIMFSLRYTPEESQLSR